MAVYTQDHRELSITTPLGKDFLLLTGLSGAEAISEIFSFQLDLLAELATKIEFEKVVGQQATVEMRLPTGEKRYFDGLIKRLTQGKRDEHFVYFRAELVPKLWLLTKKVRSRIFQQITVPDILGKVFSGLDVSYKLSANYYNRDYCVQYRESDFAFASRLMEEEGIYYFFDHTSNNHQLVVTDDATQHPPVSGQLKVTYDEISGGVREDLRITSWEKTQELRSGQYTLWDHCFEQPGKNLEAKDKTIASVAAGKITHKLNVGGNDQLEIYDFPGGYAQRFDGVTRSGADQSQSLSDIFRDKDRTVRIRMEQEEVESVAISGGGDCGYFSPGHRFTLERHFDADGAYLLTRVRHEARIVGNYRTADALVFNYENQFTCIPLDLPYRPQRSTPKPIIAGHQTATVVGPQGEELFCDKYGRVKVQFHWDREGKKDGDSSCWIRVAQVWAGKRWGAFFWPRIGHEVAVAFEEGDPDQPLIIGSVYNAENMPWFALPDNKNLAGFKSATFSGTAGKNYNGIVFNDQQGREHLALHSENNLSLNSERDKMIHSGANKGERVAVANILTVGKLLPSGGSGGGDDVDNVNENVGDYSEPENWGKGNAIAYPAPTGLGGVNAQTVFGVNQQTIFGLTNQTCLGESQVIAINPFVLVPHGTRIPLLDLIGHMVGGNLLMTVGRNAQFTCGQNFDLCVGREKIEKSSKPSSRKCTCLLVGILCAMELAYVFFYNFLAGIAGDKDRSWLVVIAQGVVSLLAGTILRCESFLAEDEEATISERIRGIFYTPKLKERARDPKDFHLDFEDKKDADKGGDLLSSVDGENQIEGNYLVLHTRSPRHDEGKPQEKAHVIALLASGTAKSHHTDGRILVRGSKGVRITSGPADEWPVDNKNVDGVEIITGLGQAVKIQRGLEAESHQKIEFTPGKIEINGGAIGEISLSVGESKISLTKTGIVIKGLITKIN